MNTQNKKRSFFDRLTGSVHAEEEEIEDGQEKDATPEKAPPATAHG